MTQTTQRKPDASHPITITQARGRTQVRWKGKIIADTTHALELKEASYPAVKYIPRADADMSLLRRSERHSHCPYKGDASYFSIEVDGETARDAIWTYEQPFDAVAAIKDHLAFYADRVDAIEEVAG